MHSFVDAKLMAKALRHALVQRQIELSHSDCLELVAKQFNLANWNTLSALIEAAGARNTPLPLPRDWVATGQTGRKYYRLGLDPAAPGTALIECLFSRHSGVDLSDNRFATIMQSILADEFRGQNLRLTARIRTEDADCGTIWMRVDGPPGASSLRFDNLMERTTDGPLSGTSAWTERQIILDIPDEAQSVHYGFFLKGYGRVSARSFRLDAADRAVATTDSLPRRNGSALPRSVNLPRPTNLDFSEPSPPAA
jgi:hypothetical protein